MKTDSHEKNFERFSQKRMAAHSRRRSLFAVAAVAPLVLGTISCLSSDLGASPSGKSSKPVVPIGGSAEDGFTNSLGMKLIPVKRTKVFFCIHTVRMKDYSVYAAEVSGVDDSWRDQVFYNKRVAVGDNHPVVGVNWNDAKAFCAWLSKKEGRIYRLPTDREWSIAVGLGSLEKVKRRTTPIMLSGKEKEVWSWGTKWPPPKGAGNFADTVCKQEYPNLTPIPDYTDGYATTAPVMSFKPNKYGLYDMGGNVQQWCEDRFTPDKPDRVERGGHYGLGGKGGGDFISSRRDHHPPGVRGAYTGFRVVVEAP